MRVRAEWILLTRFPLRRALSPERCTGGQLLCSALPLFKFPNNQHVSSGRQPLPGFLKGLVAEKQERSKARVCIQAALPVTSS